jgi:hypothetical protein
MGGQLDIRRQPDSFRATPDPSARAATFSQEFAQGRIFFLAQPVCFAALVIASLWLAFPP